jgi:hypothetical protein
LLLFLLPVFKSLKRKYASGADTKAG